MRDLGRTTAMLLGAAALAGGAEAADGLLTGMDRLREDDASQTLLARIEARAPVGGPEAKLADWLVSEGFKVRRLPGPNATRYGEAFKTAGSPVCRKQAMVQWRAAASGAVTWLDARYGVGDCL